MAILLEDYLPVVKLNGLNTAKAIDFSGASSMLLPAGVTLGAGTTLTTPVVAGGLTASGSASNNFSGSTGAFTTSSGANTLSGDVTIAANKNLSMAAGTGAVDLSLATGIFKTPSGLSTISGGLAGSVQSFTTPSVVNLTTIVTKITITTDNSSILADGVDGQIKILIVVATNGDSVTITPTTAFAFTDIVLNQLGDRVVLVFIAPLGWVKLIG